MNSYEFEEYCKAMPYNCIDLTKQRMVEFVRNDRKPVKIAKEHRVLPMDFIIGAVGMLVGGATALFAVLLAIGG